MRKHLNIPRTNAQTRSSAIAAKAQSKGHSVAQVLAGSWRLSPSRLHLSTEELAEAIPLRLRCGSAALGWWRVRRSDPQTCAAGQELQQAYRLHTIQSALHEQQLKDVFRRTRAAGIEPLLWKGWAVARLYPEPGLRPYGDIDLLVSPRELAPAELALRSRTGRLYCVELHTSLYKQYERTPYDVLAHSRSVLLDDVPIRVPSEEDHLRYLCLHFLHHGAWRPLWLCDIALVMLPSTGTGAWEERESMLIGWPALSGWRINCWARTCRARPSSI